MKVVPFDESAFHMDHPRGTVAFNYLLLGEEPDSPNNFQFILSRREGDFHMPRHRHTFEQIRLPLLGDMNLGRQGMLREGHIGYFPEGLIYGPQDDPLGSPKELQLTLQFGGASGLGIRTFRARVGNELRPNRAPRDEVREQKFPRSRYRDVIVANPENFYWLPVRNAPGVEHKFMGAYSERGVWIEFIKIATGAEWRSSDPIARRLFVVLSGEGAVEGQDISRLAALQVDAGDELRIAARQEVQLYLIGLPPVELPAVDQDVFDAGQSTGGSAQFEDPTEAAASPVAAAR